MVKDRYTYGDQDWQDLLTKFNDTAISYDASGNPLNWFNGNAYSGLSWVMGRQLESMTVETDTEELDISYSYDMSGIRSSKTIVIGEVEVHTHEYTSSVTAPTCTTAGFTTYTCECGASYVDNLVDALGHNYVQSGNVYTCSRCGDSYTGHEHSYTESTTEPTCLTAGYTTYTCSCGDTYTVDLPALGHDYVLVNQSGTTGTYQCSRCGHTYSATIPVTPPTEEYSLRSSSPTEYHEYIYASGRLMREIITTTANGTSTTEVLDFVYGSGSTPLALVYTNGTASPVTYYYVTNIQGDVVKMVTASGTTVASYTYDAWGKVISATGDMAEVNPIRYRGYYYDAETGLYYLQSRYYDPSVKRFVNADGIATTGQGFLGYNMFAYCNNNPISASDMAGYAANWTNRVDMQDGWPSTDPRSARTWPRIPVIRHRTDEETSLNNGTRNRKISAQGKDPAGALKYGSFKMSYNGCEVIAIHNALVQLGRNSTLLDVSDTLQDCNAMTVCGVFGSKPGKIDDAFHCYGVGCEEVEINEMTEPGVYVVAYWTEYIWCFYSIHTIAISSINDFYRKHNKEGEPDVAEKRCLNPH